MPRLTAHPFTLRLATATVAACLLAGASASAQVGTAVTPIDALVYPGGFVSIGFSGTDQATAATAVGGVTLFAASAPNGPVLVRFPFLPPYYVDPESSVPAPWTFNSVPPGTYYVALVYGVVAAPNIAVADWTPLVVAGTCNTAPGIGLLDRRSAGAEPNTVRLFMSTFGGCATSYLVEAGTSPGASNVASFEQTAVLLNAGGVPSGSYYVRMRGRNQFGIGPYSAVLPVSVPGCPTDWVEIGTELNATVVGHQVTLSWAPPVPAPVHGGPVTFYELARLDGLPPDTPPVRYLLPVTATSFSATLPSGSYAVGLYAGNSCRSDPIASLLVTVP